MTPIEISLTAKVKLLEAENFKLKNMLKSNFNATCRYVEMLAKMDELLIKRNNEIDHMRKSSEKTDSKMQENLTVTLRFVEMLSEMDDLLVKRRNELDRMQKSLDEKTTKLNDLKIQLKAAQESMPNSLQNAKISDYYEDRQKRAREIQNIKQSKTKDGLYKCRMCEYSSKHWWSLEKHIRIDTGEKPFKCDECSMRFSDASHFSRHKLVHKNERPFCCKICGMKTKQSSSLKLHCKALHGGEGFSLKRIKSESNDDIEEFGNMPIEFQ